MLTRLASMENRVEGTSTQLDMLLQLLSGTAPADACKSSTLLDQMYKKHEKEKLHLNKRLATIENHMSGMASQMNMLLQIFTPPTMPNESSSGSSGSATVEPGVTQP